MGGWFVVIINEFLLDCSVFSVGVVLGLLLHGLHMFFNLEVIESVGLKFGVILFGLHDNCVLLLILFNIDYTITPLHGCPASS